MPATRRMEPTRRKTEPMQRKTDLLRGTLDMLILRVLELQPLHGIAIADRIRQVTRDTFDVQAGSLFPALHRLEQEGWTEGAWTTNSEGRRVRSYALTRAGRRKLRTETEQWERIVTAVTRVLEMQE
jgi:PadR family transcriptional regulator PadR